MVEWQELFVTKQLSPRARGLKPVLSLFDLVWAGLGGIIGAGIFILIGVVAQETGPAVVVSLVLAAIISLLTALCYAEFSSFLPAAGSAYTYTYVACGELPAWLVGWSILLEYTLLVAAIARGWAGYVVNLLLNFNSGPETDHDIVELDIEGTPFSLNPIAPIIIALLTVITILGVHETAQANAVFCAVKIVVLIIVFIGGMALGDWDNFASVEFAPTGVEGIGLGTATIMMAYYGFDGLSTLSEEAINPKRDMPRAILLSCLISSTLYVMTGLALTVLVKHDTIDIDAPLSDAFNRVGAGWMATLIAFGAFMGVTSALMMGLLGQTRVWFALADDGLLPASFATVHPKYQTPYVAAGWSSSMAMVFGTLLGLEELAKLVAVGTLFAFASVSTCLLYVRYERHVRVLYCGGGIWLFTAIANFLLHASEIDSWFALVFFVLAVLSAVPLFLLDQPESKAAFVIPFGPLVPVLSIVANLCTMGALEATVWWRFGVWMVIGIVIYFAYGINHSKARGQGRQRVAAPPGEGESDDLLADSR